MRDRDSSLIEPSPAPEFFVSGLARVEPLGPCVRLWWYTLSQIAEAPTEQHRVVVNRMILPADALVAVARQLTASPEERQLDMHRTAFSAAN